MFNLKNLIALTIIAAAAIAAALSSASYNTAPESERGFELAQRRCPNGNC